MDQLAQSFQRVIFTLDRNQDRVCRCHGIDCQDIQRRRAVQQNKIIIILNKIQRIPQYEFFMTDTDQFNLRRGQIDIGRNHIHIWDYIPENRFIHAAVIQQQFIDCIFLGVLIHAKTAGRIALGININDQHPLPLLGQGRCQVNGSGGLADSAFLIGYRYYFSHAFLYRSGLRCRRPSVLSPCIRGISVFRADLCSGFNTLPVNPQI